MAVILFAALMGALLAYMVLMTALLYFWPAVITLALSHLLGLGSLGCAVVFVLVLAPFALSCAYRYQQEVRRSGSGAHDALADLWRGFNPAQSAIALLRFGRDLYQKPRAVAAALLAHAEDGWC